MTFVTMTTITWATSDTHAPHLHLQKCLGLDGIGLRSNRTGLSSATNLKLVLAVIRAVYICGGPVVKASILPFFTAAHQIYSWCDGMGCYPIRHMVTPNIDLRHYNSQTVLSWHLSATFSATHGRASRSNFSTGQCSAAYRKGVTGLPPPNDFSSLAYLNIRFVTIWAYLSSLWTARWKTNRYGQIRGSFTSIFEGDTFGHQKRLVCFISRPFWIIKTR